MNKISATVLMCVMVLTTMIPLAVATTTRETSDWSDDFQDASKIELSENLSIAKNNVTLYRNGYADPFTGVDGTVPDGWNVSAVPYATSLGASEINENRLMVWVVTRKETQENVSAWTNTTFGSSSFSTELNISYWLGAYMEAERCIEVRISVGKNTGSQYQYFASLVYDKWNPNFTIGNTWKVYTRQAGNYSVRNSTSNIVNGETGLIVRINTTNSSFEPVITRKSDNSVVYQPGSFSYDTIENWSFGLATVDTCNETWEGNGDKCYSYWDNLTVKSTESSNIGKVRSVPIVLPQNRVWGTVHINKTVPSGTFLNVSVLDPDNKTIITGSGSDINISSLDYSSIKLEAVLEGTEAESPVLQGWSVSWVPDYPRQDSSIPELSLPEDTTASFDVSSHFNDSHALQFSIGYNDCGSNITIVMTQKGNISVIPKTDWNGACSLDVLVSDGEFELRSNSFKVKVTPVNDAPVFASIPPTNNATVGETWHYNLSATDIDGDTLSFGLEKSPAGMVLTASDIDYLPIAEDNGTLVPVNVSVTDGTATVWQDFVVGLDPIVPANNPPVFTSMPESLATSGIEYTYDANATDADGDVLTFGIVSGPAGPTIDAVSGLFKWTPEAAGPAVVVLEVTDGRDLARQTFTILVTEKSNGTVPPTNNTNGTIPPNGNNTNGTIPPNGNNTNGTIPPNGNNTNGTSPPPDGGTDNGFLSENLWPIVAVAVLTSGGLVSGVYYYKKKSEKEAEELELSEDSPKSTAVSTEEETSDERVEE